MICAKTRHVGSVSLVDKKKWPLVQLQVNFPRMIFPVRRFKDAIQLFSRKMSFRSILVEMPWRSREGVKAKAHNEKVRSHWKRISCDNLVARFALANTR